jgi:hypothetical protein
MARGGHGLRKVSLGPAMLASSVPCGQATPETALELFLWWPTHRVGGLCPSSTPWIPQVVRLRVRESVATKGNLFFLVRKSPSTLWTI